MPVSSGITTRAIDISEKIIKILRDDSPEILDSELQLDLIIGSFIACWSLTMSAQEGDRKKAADTLAYLIASQSKD